MDPTPSLSSHEETFTSNMISGGRGVRLPSVGICDLLHTSPLLSGGASLYFCEQESILFDYFRTICARDFALYYESPIWESLILRLSHQEPFAYHAALAISALSRQHYIPSQSTLYIGRVPVPVHDFATKHYSRAITTLNSRLGATTQGLEIALLGSILFVNLEFLLAGRVRESSVEAAIPYRTRVHTQGAMTILNHLKQEGKLRMLSHYQDLEAAVLQTWYQVSQFQFMNGKTGAWKL